MDRRDELSPSAEAEIAKITQQVSVANHLDGEIREELRTHVEDKVRDYLSGKIKPTEADALLLSKWHFGKAETVQRLLCGIHPVASRISLVKRVLMGLLLMMAVSYFHDIILDLSDCIAQRLELWATNRSGEAYMLFVINIAYQAASVLLSIGLGGLILRLWRRRVTIERDGWIVRWRLSSVLCVGALLLFCLAWANLYTRSVSQFFPTWSILMELPTFEVNPAYVASLKVVYAVQSVLNVSLWLWWCGKSVRTWRAFAATALLIPLVPTFALGLSCFVRDIIVSVHFRDISFEVTQFYVRHVPSNFFSERAIVNNLVVLLGLTIYFLHARRKMVAGSGS